MLFWKGMRKTMTDFLTVRGGCPLGWETEILHRRELLQNSEVSWLSFCYGNFMLISKHDFHET